MAAPGFTEKVLHPAVGSLIGGMAGANPSTSSPTGTAAPMQTKGKRNKFKKLTPEQAGAFLGMGTMPLQRYVPQPPNPRDTAIAWSSTLEEGLSSEGAKGRLSDAYFAMRESYSQEFPEDIDCASMPAAMALINIPSEQTAFIASVVKRQNPGVTGPMRVLHPMIMAAMPAGQRHRTNFACAEMHALNNLLLAYNGAVPTDAEARVFGTPDGEDPGKNGAKKFMPPCQTSAQGVGCSTVLASLGVGFLRSG